MKKESGVRLSFATLITIRGFIIAVVVSIVGCPSEHGFGTPAHLKNR
jgi:hypothetical protein